MSAARKPRRDRVWWDACAFCIDQGADGGNIFRPGQETVEVAYGRSGKLRRVHVLCLPLAEMAGARRVA